MNRTTATPPPRRRGRPRLIDRERIVAAASRLDPATLTMQSVADSLGVNRKALSYHVADRDELLRLVAEDSLSNGMPRTGPVSEDWRDVVRWYGHALRDSVISAGAVARHLDLGSAGSIEALRPTEVLLAALDRAGFPVPIMLAATTMLADLSISSGRWAIATGRPETDPAMLEVRALLDRLPDGEFATLQKVADAVALKPDAQFAFNIGTAIAGMEVSLAAVE